MPVRIDLTSNASVRMIDVNEDNLACAYLANLYIPIFSLDTSKIIRRIEVANQIAGIHFTHKKKHVFYAIDDSFGLHTFDTRTDSKKKSRLNPESENHNVVATALSSNGETLAVASAEFGGGILDVRGSRRRENHPHVVSLYDTRMAGEPITSYYKRFKADVTGMEFYLNGHDLLIGDQSGSIQVFDTTLRDEDNAFRWGRYVKGPITKVGIINKRIVYTISNKSEASVFVDAKGKLEVLYGAVSETSSQSIEKVSKAYFKKPEWCAGLVKGVDDNLPLVAVHGVDKKNFLSLTAMDQNGIREATPMLSYNGHVGEVKCMKATPELLLTGGEDGKVVVQIANFRNPKFGEDMIEHHRLTIKRGDLAELEEKGKADNSENSEDSDEEDSGKKPSTSSAMNNSSASSSSAASSPAKKVKKEESDKEDSDDDEDSSESDSSESDDDKDPKQKEKERKKKERERRRQLKREKEKEERRKAKEKKKKEKEEKERKEKEAAKAKKRAAKEAKEQEEADRKKKAKEAKKKEREAKEEAEKEEKRKEKERKKKERAELKAKEVAEKAKEDQATQEKERKEAQKKQEAKEKAAKEERKAKEREAAKEKERQAAKAKESSKDDKSSKDKPSTSEASSSSRTVPTSEKSSLERREEYDRIKAERRAAERAKDPVAFDAERERRRLAKLAETPEQRAERKAKAREERRKQREEEERAMAENGAKRPRVE
ncbi:hypothetical protein CAEBREN_07793 [Caenorhabditis brenneri]|uniref:WD repeat-containing protein 89 n=1 Tax=Caenorhabditis brenneri TaxID=135651 RepID=G0MXA7_CAEBE|nr:hypothetical protein CAEBREN_07793 [Caenorhabditis brenneri]